MKKYLSLFIVLLAAAVCSAAAPDSMLSKKAPNFNLESVDGNNVRLEALLDGRTIVILSFFDSKCEPCKKELPLLENVRKSTEAGALNVKIFLIGLDEQKSVIAEWREKQKTNITVLHDPLGYKAAENYGVSKYGRSEIPQVFVIGKDGKIKKHFKGLHTDIDKVILSLIGELKNQATAPAAAGNQINILYTNSANGYLESCNCPENPFGGLVRRATAIRQLKEKYPGAFTVDSGDILSPRENTLLAEYCLKMTESMKYDAVGVGDQELICGIDFLKKNIERLPFISANLQACDEKMCYPLTKPYIIKNHGNLKIAFVSVIDPSVFDLFPQDKVKNIKTLDNIEYLKRSIPEIRKEADIIVLLSHCGDDADRKIAADIPGIDVIVGGHSQTFHKEPLKISNTVIVQGGENGHRVGRLELKLGEDKKIASYANEFIVLNKDVPDDPATKELVKQYNSDIKKSIQKLVK